MASENNSLKKDLKIMENKYLECKEQLEKKDLVVSDIHNTPVFHNYRQLQKKSQ